MGKAMETVKFKFYGTARVPVSGDIDIPKEMADRIDPDDAWSEEIEKYIQQNVDGLNHFDVGGTDDDDIELYDVERSK